MKKEENLQVGNYKRKIYIKEFIRRNLKEFIRRNLKELIRSNLKRIYKK